MSHVTFRRIDFAAQVMSKCTVSPCARFLFFVLSCLPYGNVSSGVVKGSVLREPLPIDPVDPIRCREDRDVHKYIIRRGRTVLDVLVVTQREPQVLCTQRSTDLLLFMVVVAWEMGILTLQ